PPFRSSAIRLSWRFAIASLARLSRRFWKAGLPSGKHLVLLGPRNSELLHPVDQGRAVQAKFCRRAPRTADHPPDRVERIENQVALGVLQGCRRWSGEDVSSAGRRQRIGKDAIIREDHGPFDEVLQL